MSIDATSASPPSASSLLGRGRGGASPLASLQRPFRWYVDWVRANPENASSMEQMSRTFTLLIADPGNLISAEACFTVNKLHALSNYAIVSTGAHRTSKTELLSFILQAIQEVECLMELIYRKFAGHRNTWDALLLMEAVKSVLKICVHRQLFFVPWLWESLRVSLRRALRRLIIGVHKPRRARAPPAQAAAMTGMAKGGSTAAAGIVVAANGVALSPGDEALIENGLYDYGMGAVGSGTNLCGAMLGPNNTRLVIPRVTSDRRTEHRHYFNPATLDDGEDGAAMQRDDVAAFDAAEADAEEAGEAIPFTWIDVLGMGLDLYLLFRPLVLVALARRSFLRRSSVETKSIAQLPPVVSRADRAAAAKEAEKTGKKSTNGPDVLAAVHNAIASAPTETLMGSWKVWGAVAASDLLVAFLSRLVRHRRVPVVYIHDAHDVDSVERGCAEETGRDSTPPPLPPTPTQGGEVSQAGPDAEDAETTAPADSTSADRGAIGPVQDPPVVSRDRMRVQQALRNTFYSFLRDPFFSAVLKQMTYQHLMMGHVNRVPLIGPCVSFYVIHALSMQHYSFLYSLGQ